MVPRSLSMIQHDIWEAHSILKTLKTNKKALLRFVCHCLVVCWRLSAKKLPNIACWIVAIGSNFLNTWIVPIGSCLDMGYGTTELGHGTTFTDAGVGIQKFDKKGNSLADRAIN